MVIKRYTVDMTQAKELAKVEDIPLEDVTNKLQIFIDCMNEAYTKGSLETGVGIVLSCGIITGSYAFWELFLKDRVKVCIEKVHPKLRKIYKQVSEETGA